MKFQRLSEFVRIAVVSWLVLGAFAHAQIVVQGVVRDTDGQLVKDVTVRPIRWRFHGKLATDIATTAPSGATTNRDYIAFTEPDYPDRHSYQPGPEREVFGGIEVRF